MVLLAGQVILGGVTVKTETAASVVALHLSMALTLFTLLIGTAVTAFVLEKDSVRLRLRRARLLRRVDTVPILAMAGRSH
jgi:heme A synthase